MGTINVCERWDRDRNNFESEGCLVWKGDSKAYEKENIIRIKTFYSSMEI